MMASKHLFPFAAVILMIFFLPQIRMVYAADNESLDEIVQGFEDDDDPAQALDEVMDGFGDEETFLDESGHKDMDPAAEVSREEKLSPVRLDGDVSFGVSYNTAHSAPGPGETDWRGLSRLRTELQLELDVKFSGDWKMFASTKGAYDFVYQLKGRENYTREVLDAYEKELELRDTYLQGRLTQNLDLKAGRQIVVWGKSDSIRVTDVLNPIDLREPGLTDIEDIRLPVAMTKIDYYLGSWRLSGMAIHEIRFNKLPAYGSDFYPAPVPPVPEETPSCKWENTEYALAVSGVFSGWDLSFYWADIYSDLPHLEIRPEGVVSVHAPLTMMGTAFNVAAGNWLFKAEAAYLDGFMFLNSGDATYARFDLLAGFEYYGFKNTTISLDVVNRHFIGFQSILEQFPDEGREDEFQSAFRLTRQFLNDTLSLTLLASTFGFTSLDGAFQRFSAEYDLTDAIQLSGGLILYQSGDLPSFRQIGDNDRIFADIKYSF